MFLIVQYSFLANLVNLPSIVDICVCSYHHLGNNSFGLGPRIRSVLCIGPGPALSTVLSSFREEK